MLRSEVREDFLKGTVILSDLGMRDFHKSFPVKEALTFPEEFQTARFINDVHAKVEDAEEALESGNEFR